VWREIGRSLQRYVASDRPVVDIACDQGYFIRNIISVDRWAVDVRDMRPHLPPDVTFVHCDAPHLGEHLSGGFATALMSTYLEHLPLGDAVIAQLSAVHMILQPSSRGWSSSIGTSASLGAPTRTSSQARHRNRAEVDLASVRELDGSRSNPAELACPPGCGWPRHRWPALAGSTLMPSLLQPGRSRLGVEPAKHGPPTSPGYPPIRSP
jgi:hypothetical protein